MTSNVSFFLELMWPVSLLTIICHNIAVLPFQFHYLVHHWIFLSQESRVVVKYHFVSVNPWHVLHAFTEIKLSQSKNFVLEPQFCAEIPICSHNKASIEQFGMQPKDINGFFVIWTTRHGTIWDCEIQISPLLLLVDVSFKAVFCTTCTVHSLRNIEPSFINWNGSCRGVLEKVFSGTSIISDWNKDNRKPLTYRTMKYWLRLITSCEKQRQRQLPLQWKNTTHHCNSFIPTHIHYNIFAAACKQLCY